MPNGPTPQADRIEGVTYVERRPLYHREEALCRPEEAPVPIGGPLCQKVLCAERIGGGPCVGRRLKWLCRVVRLLYAEGTAGGNCTERRPSVPGGPLC